MKEKQISDSLSCVSMDNPSLAIKRRAIERIVLFELPEYFKRCNGIYKKTLIPIKPRILQKPFKLIRSFTLEDELVYWEEKQSIYLCRDDKEFIEHCKLKIKGLERKFENQKAALFKATKEVAIAAIYREGNQKELEIPQIVDGIPAVCIPLSGKHSAYIKKTLIEHSENWDYYFESIADLDKFVNCLNNYFEHGIIPDGKGRIKTKKGCITKLGKALNPIYGHCTSCSVLRKDKGFFNAVRILEAMNDKSDYRISRMM